MGTALAANEKTRLSVCEATIEKGMTTFVDVGNALAEIQTGRLYRETHDTFDLYLKDRWSMSRTRAHELIKGAAAVQNVRNCEQTPPKLPNSSQAKELAKAPPEKQSEAWKKASEDGKPTAAKVKKAVAEVQDDPLGDFPDPPAKPDEPPPITIDELAAPYKKACDDLNRIKREFSALASNMQSGGYLRDKITRITGDLTGLKNTLWQMMPIEFCADCGGDGCELCFHTGFVTRAAKQREGGA